MGSLGPQFGASPITLKQRSLDVLLTEMGIHQVAVIKIDVEGAEIGVLRGAQRLLASERPPVIVFEFADWAEERILGQQPGDAQALLLSNGYRLFHIESGGKTGREISDPVRRGFGMFVALPSHVSGFAR